MYDFDEIISREGTDSVKYDSIKKDGRFPEGTIPLWIADMDFSCPPELLDAIRERLDRRILGYTAVIDEDYFTVLDNWFLSRYGWKPGIRPVLSPGVVKALENIVKTVTAPGDTVVVFTPSYGPFKSSVDKAPGRIAKCCPLIYSGGSYSVDWNAFAEICAMPETTLFIMCNPHNPTGKIWTEEELRRIGSICFDNGVFVISDEIHADLTRSTACVTPFAKVFPDEKRRAVCTAPSKTFNVAGLQFSNIFIYDETVREQWRREYSVMPNPLSLAAAEAAYAKCGAWLDELRVYLDVNFEFLKDYITAHLPEAVFEIPAATYLAWVNLSAYCRDNEKLEAAIAAAGVYVEAGQNFVGNADGFVRINCACPRSLLREAAARMAAAVKAL